MISNYLVLAKIFPLQTSKSSRLVRPVDFGLAIWKWLRLVTAGPVVSFGGASASNYCLIFMIQ